MTQSPSVLLLSLEPWDLVWRRNQHLVSALVRDEWVGHVTFLEPAVRRGKVQVRGVQERVTAVRPVQPWPDRAGGKRLLARWVRHRLLAGVDLLWVNDAPLGALVLSQSMPALHDVTDDWRCIPQPPRATEALVAAEDRLARHAHTVVCSSELAKRWLERYGVQATVVPNAVDPAAWQSPVPVVLDGSPPHVLYAGTLHADRLDLHLVQKIASAAAVGTMHLVGPNMLSTVDSQQLRAAGVHFHAPVPAAEVAGWLTAADVLVLPHRVDAFTLSLDAIKAYEYMAARRPVVATPTSGFQSLGDLGVCVAEPRDFVARLDDVLSGSLSATPHVVPATWAERAAEMAAVINPLLSR